jgi:hypothetical protein
MRVGPFQVERERRLRIGQPLRQSEGNLLKVIRVHRLERELQRSVGGEVHFTQRIVRQTFRVRGNLVRVELLFSIVRVIRLGAL